MFHQGQIGVEGDNATSYSRKLAHLMLMFSAAWFGGAGAMLLMLQVFPKAF